MNFDDAFNRLVDPEHEGGYVNDPNGPGGAVMENETNQELTNIVRSAVSSGIKDALHDREELLCAAENAAVTAINR